MVFKFKKKELVIYRGGRLFIYLAFPIWTVPLGNQIVDEGKSFFIKVFQLVNENKLLELKYHQLATPSELTNIGESRYRGHRNQEERYGKDIPLLFCRQTEITVLSKSRSVWCKVVNHQGHSLSLPSPGNSLTLITIIIMITYFLY